MPCPACKIIINGGLVEPLAEQLANVSKDEDVRSSASKLADAAHVFNAVVAVARVNGILHQEEAHEADFDGCNEAQLLLGWIARAKGHLDDSQSVTTTSMREQMHAWTANLYAETSKIVSGTE